DDGRAAAGQRRPAAAAETASSSEAAGLAAPARAATQIRRDLADDRETGGRADTIGARRVMARTEIFHNTREQVVEGVRDAVAIADELELSPDDRTVLLPLIVNQLTAKQINLDAPMAAVMPAMDIPRGNGRR